MTATDPSRHYQLMVTNHARTSNIWSDPAPLTYEEALEVSRRHLSRQRYRAHIVLVAEAEPHLYFPDKVVASVLWFGPHMQVLVHPGAHVEPSAFHAGDENNCARCSELGIDTQLVAEGDLWLGGALATVAGEDAECNCDLGKPTTHLRVPDIQGAQVTHQWARPRGPMPDSSLKARLRRWREERRKVRERG